MGNDRPSMNHQRCSMLDVDILDCRICKFLRLRNLKFDKKQRKTHKLVKSREIKTFVLFYQEVFQFFSFSIYSD